jgi:nucleoside-diphosphate-sugar epimerase
MNETPSQTPIESAGAFRGERVLVTGATGFIGRWVARLLSAAGADLFVAARDRDQMARIAAEYEITGPMLEVDLARESAVRDVLREIRPACVFNLAGYGVDPSERDPGLADRLNRDLVEWLADGVSRHGADEWRGVQLVHVGSALEYGTAAGNLVESTVEQPTTLYGRTKLEGTRRLMARSAQGELRAVVARLFTVYGPGEDPRRLLPSLLAAAARSERLELTNGEQRRDFTYAGDAAEGLLRLALCDARGGLLTNLATGRLTTVREFCLLAAAELGMPADDLAFGALPTRPEEMQHDPVSISRLRSLTGWTPATTIGEGVRATATFLRSQATRRPAAMGSTADPPTPAPPPARRNG